MSLSPPATYTLSSRSKRSNGGFKTSRKSASLFVSARLFGSKQGNRVLVLSIPRSCRAMKQFYGLISPEKGTPGVYFQILFRKGSVIHVKTESFTKIKNQWKCSSGWWSPRRSPTKWFSILLREEDRRSLPPTLMADTTLVSNKIRPILRSARRG